MKKVLFIGATDFDLEGKNRTLEKKYLGLSRKMRVFVLARGKKGEYEKYQAKFFLMPKKFGKAGMPLWLAKVFFKANKIIRQEHIDTVVSQSPTFDGLISAVLKKINKIELIVEAHGDWIGSPFYYFRLPFQGLIKRILAEMGKFSLKRADKIRAVSGYTGSLARKYAPKGKKIYVFNTFSDIDIFKNETDISYEKYIYYAGWLYRLKGIHILIKAFLKIKKDFPDFKLLITGAGPYKEKLLKLADNDPRIGFTGWKQQKEVKEMMKKCWAYCLPSFLEGFPRVLIEASMLRKAMIGSRTGGIPDMIKDGKNGFLFEAGNSDELAEKLKKIMKDKDLARRMGEAGRRLSEDKYSLKRYFQNYSNMIYEKKPL